MAPGTAAPAASQLARKLRRSSIERYPFAIVPVAEALEAVAGRTPLDSAGDRRPARLPFAARAAVVDSTSAIRRLPMRPLPEWRRGALRARRSTRSSRRATAFLRRAALVQSLTADERREILRGMVLTRATDNRLKTFFTSGEVRYGETTFQGKGFRSLGQEAIYAAGIRLRRGDSYRADDGWRGDVIAPMIRDLGLSLAMRPEPETVRMVLSAQMGKAGPPMNGKDLHIGDFDCGHPAGDGAARDRRADDRRHGDGVRARGTRPRRASRSSAKAARRSASGTRRSTSAPRAGCRRSSACRTTRPRSRRRCASSPRSACSPTRRPATASRASRSTAPIPTRSPRRSPGRPSARAPGTGPTLIELVSMRMCGHAHHDDMLYLGKDAAAVVDYPPLTRQGYADRELYAYWRRRDPIPAYAARLEAEGVIDAGRSRRASSARPRRSSKRRRAR